MQACRDIQSNVPIKPRAANIYVHVPTCAAMLGECAPQLSYATPQHHLPHTSSIRWHKPLFGLEEGEMLHSSNKFLPMGYRFVVPVGVAACSTVLCM